MATTTVMQCNSCGGLFQPTQADGTSYYHACPPQRLVTPAVVDPVSGKTTQPAVYQPLPNRRDENVLSVDSRGVITIKSQGGGVTPVLDPAVITTAGFQ